MLRSLSFSLFAFCLLCFVPTAARAVSRGQIDTFTDGTTQSWAGPSIVINIPQGGPDIYGDRYLSVQPPYSGGQLSTTNRTSRWTGNYTNAGVTAIEADLLNLGLVNLEMRVFITAANYGTWTSTTPVILPPGNNWQHVVFSLRPADLTWVSSSAHGQLSDAMRYVDTLGIRHQSGSPANPGTTIASEFGIDNVQATPEPTAGLLLLGGLLVAFRRR